MCVQGLGCTADASTPFIAGPLPVPMPPAAAVQPVEWQAQLVLALTALLRLAEGTQPQEDSGHGVQAGGSVAVQEAKCLCAGCGHTR